jgi:hypothetical protein
LQAKRLRRYDTLLTADDDLLCLWREKGEASFDDPKGIVSLRASHLFRKAKIIKLKANMRSKGATETFPYMSFVPYVSLFAEAMYLYEYL